MVPSIAIICVACAGRQLLRSVGGFFGLTEASQRGNNDVIGWQEFNERNLEVDAFHVCLVVEYLVVCSV